MRKTIAVNDRGQPVGEDHPGTRLTDHEVELIRELHAQGMSYNRLAEKFDAAKSTIQAICQFKRRAATATRWRTVRVLSA